VDRNEELERENRLLLRRLGRLQANVQQLEEFQDANATLLSRVLDDLEAERVRSRALLLNVLPERILARLEAGEHPIADAHDAVAVLFSDFAGFTAIAARLAPTVLIDELNALFSAFDEICERHGLERIKTIGDAYLAIGGLPGGQAGAAAVADAALEMTAFVSGRSGGAADWRVRIGLHLGPIVAGIVGTSRFAYDVWGDTVNVASRLESTSEPGKIHISTEFAARLGAGYRVEPRGTVELKGKGPRQTSWLVSKPEAP
jgi:class 3 adenylate cyclase